MGGSRGPRTPTALALVLAVAVAALTGYVISRPRAGSHDTSPIDSPIPTPNSPFSTIGFSVADDVANHQVVVFGGDLSLNQTWLWNGTSWKLSHPRTSPVGREEAAMAYDPELHMVLLFGGISPVQTFLDDTWGWDGTTWHELDPGHDGPPPGQAAMAWDPALDAMVLVAASNSGTDTWTWSGTHWVDHRQIDPYLPTGVLLLAFDPAVNRLIGVGFGNVIGPGVGAVTQTWTWDGVTWRQITTPRVPSGYGVLGLGWDPVTARLLLFLEGPVTPVPILAWAFTGSDWMQLPSPVAPRLIEGLLTGADTGTLFLVGELSEAQGASTPLDVWAWTGSAWKR